MKGFPTRFPVRDDDRRPLRYHTAAVLSRLYLNLSWRRPRIVGAENIPDRGPLLVVVNHVSNLDPLVVGGYFPLTLFAMAKRELYFNRLAAWFLAGCNCIPVNRGGADRRAVTRALEVLRRDGRLLVFVEGTRSPNGTMQRAQSGIGFLARRSGAAVLPTAVTGTDDRNPPRSRRRRVAVLRYGAPFTLDLEGRRDDAVIADEIAVRIADLLPAERRGFYARATEQEGTRHQTARSSRPSL